MAHTSKVAWVKYKPSLKLCVSKGSFVLLKMTFRKMFSGKWLTGKHFTKKKREKREIKIRKMFSPFQIRKTFYRKMALFSVDQENVFSWPLIFRETNTQKYWKYFPVSHFQWNKRTLSCVMELTRSSKDERTHTYKWIFFFSWDIWGEVIIGGFKFLYCYMSTF